MLLISLEETHGDQVAANSRVTAIFLNNDIMCDADTKGLYLNLALTNHSCAPNW